MKAKDRYTSGRFNFGKYIKHIKSNKQLRM